MHPTSPWITMLILLVVFLICREIICWYWKMNDVVSLLKDIKKLLNDINVAQQAPQDPKKKTTSVLKKCKKCGALTPEKEPTCSGCGAIFKEST